MENNTDLTPLLAEGVKLQSSRASLMVPSARLSQKAEYEMAGSKVRALKRAETPSTARIALAVVACAAGDMRRTRTRSRLTTVPEAAVNAAPLMLYSPPSIEI